MSDEIKQETSAGEMKVRGFRIADEDFEGFKALANGNGFKTQGEAFSHLLSCWRLNHASDAMQSQANAVKEVQVLTAKLTDLFSAQFEQMQILDESARHAASLELEEVRRELDAARADAEAARQELADVQTKAAEDIAAAQSDRDAAVAAAADASKRADDADAAAADANRRADDAAQKAAAAVDGLAGIKAALDAARAAQTAAEDTAMHKQEQIDENKKRYNDEYGKLQKELKGAVAKASKVDDLKKRIDELKSELKDARAELKEANVKAASVADKLIDMQQRHDAALDAMQKRYDAELAKLTTKEQRQEASEQDSQFMIPDIPDDFPAN